MSGHLIGLQIEGGEDAAEIAFEGAIEKSLGYNDNWRGE